MFDPALARIGGLFLCVVFWFLVVALVWRQQRQKWRHARVLAHQAERERLTEAQHEALQQGMQGVLLQLQTLVDQVKGDPRLSARFEHVLDQADAVLSEGRHRDQAAREPLQDGRDLAAALQHVAQAMGAIRAVPFTLRLKGLPDVQLRPEVEAACYAVAREALLGAFRHADADRISIDLYYGRAAFELRIVEAGGASQLWFRQEAGQAYQTPPLRGWRRLMRRGSGRLGL